MRTYAHPTEARTFFSPDTEPSVATGLPILSIGGLDNFARPHPEKPAALSVEGFSESHAQNHWVGTKRQPGRVRFSGGLRAGRHVDGHRSNGRIGGVRRLLRGGHHVV